MSAAQPWNIATVSRLFEVRYGKANPGRDGKVPVIGSSGVYAWTDSPLVREPTIVVGRKGSAGQVWFIDKPCFPSDTTFYLVRRPDAEVDSEFAAYALRAHGVGASNDVIPSLQRHELENCEIPFPDRIEQRAIARILRSVETAIRVEAAICDKLAALKSATMAKLFREGLRGEPLKQTDIGEIPESWEVVRLGDVARVTTGTTPSTDKPEYYAGDIPFVKTAEIDGQVITGSTVHVSQKAVSDYRLKLYPPGTVFIAMYGQGRTRGRSALLGVTAATTQNTAAVECFDRLVPTYLWHWLDSRYDDLRGMGNLGHLSHLNLGYVKDLLIPLPSVTEQEEIANTVELIRRRLQVAKDKGRALDQLFRVMLASLMTGAIRVKDLDLAEVSHA